MCAGEGLLDSWWQKWTRSIVGGHIRSDHILEKDFVLCAIPMKM